MLKFIVNGNPYFNEQRILPIPKPVQHYFLIHHYNPRIFVCDVSDFGRLCVDSWIGFGSAVQPFSHSAIQPISHSAIQLFSYSAIQLFQISRKSVIQLLAHGVNIIFSIFMFAPKFENCVVHNFQKMIFQTWIKLSKPLFYFLPNFALDSPGNLRYPLSFETNSHPKMRYFNRT